MNKARWAVILAGVLFSGMTAYSSSSAGQKQVMAKSSSKTGGVVAARAFVFQTAKTPESYGMVLLGGTLLGMGQLFKKKEDQEA